MLSSKATTVPSPSIDSLLCTDFTEFGFWFCTSSGKSIYFPTSIGNSYSLSLWTEADQMRVTCTIKSFKSQCKWKKELNHVLRYVKKEVQRGQ